MSEQEKDPGFTVLTGEEDIQYEHKGRASSEMWRRIVSGERVFIPDYKPQQLGYWYRKARAHGDGLKLEMRQAKVNGTLGTIIERVYEGSSPEPQPIGGTPN